MKFYLKLFLFSLFFLTSTQINAANKAPIKPINRIIAVVNQQIITESDFNHALNSARAQFQQQGIQIPNSTQFESKVLDGLIFQKLQLQVAEQNNIEATKDEVEAAITTISRRNKITLEQLKQKLHSENIDFEEFKNQIKDQLTIRNLQQQAIGSSIKLTEKDLSTYQKKLEDENEVNDYHVLDYLVTLPANPSSTEKEAAQKKANQIVAQLKAGKHKFESEPTVEINDMGFQPLADLPDLFSVPLAQMGKGEVSRPLLAGNGYHVLKLLSLKKESKTIPVKQVQQLLFQKKFQEKLKTWLDKLKKQAYVKTYLTDSHGSN